MNGRRVTGSGASLRILQVVSPKVLLAGIITWRYAPITLGSCLSLSPCRYAEWQVERAGAYRGSRKRNNGNKPEPAFEYDAEDSDSQAEKGLRNYCDGCHRCSRLPALALCIFNQVIG